jgi:hypothetical protein
MNNLLVSRKIAWPAAIILIALWFMPTILHRLHSGMSAPVSQGTQGAAVQPVPEPAPEPVKPFPAELVTVEEQQREQRIKRLLGFWMGQELIEQRGICSLMLVLSELPDNPGHYLGNTTGNCLSTSPALLGLPKPRKADGTLFYPYQTSAILSGTADHGVMHFAVDKVIGEHCRPSSFTFTPFAAQLAAEWTDSCGNAHIMLNRKQQ